MDWFKKHIDTVVILGAVTASLIWMNGKFGDLEKNMSNIEKDITMIKTVLIMRNIMPSDMAKIHDKVIEKEVYH
jgi:hypothetical protein